MLYKDKQCTLITVAPYDRIAFNLISGAWSGVKTVQRIPSSKQHQASPLKYMEI